MYIIILISCEKSFSRRQTKRAQPAISKRQECKFARAPPSIEKHAPTILLIVEKDYLFKYEISKILTMEKASVNKKFQNLMPFDM